MLILQLQFAGNELTGDILLPLWQALGVNASLKKVCVRLRTHMPAPRFSSNIRPFSAGIDRRHFERLDEEFAAYTAQGT